MKVKYEKLDYQTKAVNAVVDTLSLHDKSMKSLVIDPEQLDDSVKETLLKNGEKYPGKEYLYPFPQFNIEMETGTGKTMVYLQTIMEIHKRFNENKFIIVVPSRAIKSGVEDSLNKLREYLSNTINTDPYNYFVYDSKNIGKLQSFEGNSFEIMLTTIQAFNKDTNIINQDYSEDFFGGKPLDQITKSKPIVIIDEPQSVDGSSAGKKAISSLEPKLVLRYSATHKDKQYPLLYKFGPVEAYKERMVKHIETLGIEVDTDGNIPIVQLKEKPEFKNGKLRAKVMAYKAVDGGFDKKTITLALNDSLEKKTKNPRYHSLGLVEEINSADKFIKFENGYKAELGALEGENEIWVSSQMRSLIKDHLDRELQMQDQGIKVLSLIFLDEVENYRVYSKDGFQKGKYAKIFEKTYEDVIHSNPAYKKLNDYKVPVEEVHDGYFAKDKATKYRNSNGNTKRDESAYNAIMADKEGLLTQYVPGKQETDIKAAKLRFIFSHSALKEGWDNPNVFQILTIATPKNDLTRRQKIGRGLRIPVNQKGERVYNDKQNIVTIYANETFTEFAEGLQNEYLQDGLLENKIDDNFFTDLIVSRKMNDLFNNDQSSNLLEKELTKNKENISNSKFVKPITQEESKNFVNILKKEQIIKNNGQPTISGLKKLKENEVKKRIITKAEAAGIDKESSQVMVQNIMLKFEFPGTTNRKKRINVNIGNKNNPYFNELWNKISHKVKYKVRFNEDELIDDIVYGNDSICDIQVKKMTAVQTRSRVNLLENKIAGETISQNTERLTWDELPIFDVTKELADQSGLTRQAIIKIIQQAQNKKKEFIDMIKMNPSLFVQRALKNIKVHQKNLLNRSLVYVQNGENWSKDKFKTYFASKDTLWAVPKRGLEKTLFDQIATQSSEEMEFAKSLVNEEKVKYFLKLPNWFKIPTPFGNYNPDWAILIEKKGIEKLYFVVDTKTTNEIGELRPEEAARIFAGRRAYETKGFEDVTFKAPVKVFGDLED